MMEYQMTADEKKIVAWLKDEARMEREAFVNSQEKVNAILVLHSSGIKDLVANAIEDGLHHRTL